MVLTTWHCQSSSDTVFTMRQGINSTFDLVIFALLLLETDEF